MTEKINYIRSFVFPLHSIHCYENSSVSTVFGRGLICKEKADIGDNTKKVSHSSEVYQNFPEL